MRTPAFAVFALAFGAFTSAACGDVIVDPGGGLLVDQSSGVGFPQSLPVACPPDQPDQDSICLQTGSTCEYGVSADMSCNTTLACLGDQTGGHWHARPSVACNTDACPAGPASSIDGTACTIPAIDGGIASDADELLCNMTDGVCACTTGRSGMHAHERRWVCVEPAPDCPTQRPMAGGPCAGSLACDYGSCRWKRGRLMQCDGTVWVSTSASCE